MFLEHEKKVFHINDDNKPIVFMHIPKCGGTSFDVYLQNSVQGGTSLRFFGTALHGSDIGKSYESWEFETLKSVNRGQFFADEDTRYIVAHAGFHELKDIAPQGRFVTLLREPVSRIISLRTFLRSFDDATVAKFGAHGMALIRARLSLKDFLKHPYYAAGYDNVMTRMLLDDDPLIPPSNFINHRFDDRLTAKAIARLNEFFFASAIDHPNISKQISAFFGGDGHIKIENKSRNVPSHLTCDLQSELDEETLNLLENHSRIDFKLWSLFFKDRTVYEMESFRKTIIGRCVLHHTKLLCGNFI